MQQPMPRRASDNNASSAEITLEDLNEFAYEPSRICYLQAELDAYLAACKLAPHKLAFLKNLTQDMLFSVNKLFLHMLRLYADDGFLTPECVVNKQVESFGYPSYTIAPNAFTTSRCLNGPYGDEPYILNLEAHRTEVTHLIFAEHFSSLEAMHERRISINTINTYAKALELGNEYTCIMHFIAFENRYSYIDHLGFYIAQYTTCSSGAFKTSSLSAYLVGSSTIGLSKAMLAAVGCELAVAIRYPDTRKTLHDGLFIHTFTIDVLVKLPNYYEHLRVWKHRDTRKLYVQSSAVRMDERWHLYDVIERCFGIAVQPIYEGWQQKLRCTCMQSLDAQKRL